MKSIATSVVALALLASGVAAQTFQINTPGSVSECIPTLLTWTGGSAPYYLSIEPGATPTAAALQMYGPLTGTSFTWSTNITQGTYIGLTLRDSTGATAQSAPFSINPGSNSCLSASASSAASSSASAASSTSPAASNTASAGTTSGASSTASSHSGSSTAASGTSGSSSSTSSAPAATKTSASSVTKVASAGLAGVVGVVLAAILA